MKLTYLQSKEKNNAFDDLDLEKAFDEADERCEDEDSEIYGKQIFDFDTYNLEDEFTFADVGTEFQDKPTTDPVSFIAPAKISEEEFQDMFENLNQEQRDYIMHVADGFEKNEKQILHFLTGGAGVGKSRVIKTLYQVLYRLFNSSPRTNPDVI